MTGEIRTADEEELDTIINGLESQARELENSARNIAENEKMWGFFALLSFGGAGVLEYVPSALPFEKISLASAAGACALGGLTEQYRWRRRMKRARRKHDLAAELRSESGYTPPDYDYYEDGNDSE